MAVKVGSFTKATGAATASQPITGVGFKPRAVILWTIGATSAGSWTSGYTYAIGYSARNAGETITVGSMACASETGADTTNASQRQAAKALTIVQWGETTLAECDMTSFDADGFTLSWTTNDSNAYIIHYMALGGNDFTDAKVVAWTTGTSTGNKAVTGAGFQPDFVMHLANPATTTPPASAANASLMMGAMTTAAQWYSAIISKDASASSNSARQQRTTAAFSPLAISFGWPFYDSYATYVSLDSDGFTLNFGYAPSVNQNAYALCLKGGSYYLDTFNLAGETGNQAISGVGFQPEGVLLVSVGTGNGGTYNPGSHVAQSVSATDGTANGSTFLYDETNLDISNPAAISKTDKICVMDDDFAQSVGREGSVVSLDADGFTINWSDATDNDAAGILYFAFASGSSATTHLLAGSGASTSDGAGDLHVDMAITASGASTSDGWANAIDVGPGDLRVTQAGVQIDVTREVPVNVTQSGAQIDVTRQVPVNVTQAGIQIDVLRELPVRVTQAGAGLDAHGQTIGLTQAGLQMDVHYERPTLSLNCWEFHVEDWTGTYLAYLDNAFNKAYLEQLSDLGGGSFDIPADDSKATAANLTIGNVVKVRYRNVEVGAFLIEQVSEPLVGSGEETEHIISVSGRGLMATLEKGIVYPTDITDSTTTEREFAGVTKASVFKSLYQEFEARGGGELTTGFNAVTDSRNVAWTDTVTMKFQAGQKLIDVLRQLAGLGLEVTADPDRTLQAWVSAGTDVSSSVVFRQGLNMMQAAHSSDGVDLANAVLGEGENILVESTDATSIAARGRKETYLPLRNTSDTTQVTTANQLLLNQFADPIDSYTLVVNADVLFPLFDYDLGDTVRVEIPGEVSADYRVKSIGIRERGGPCDLEVTLELNSLRREYLIRLQRSLESNLTNPSGAGVAANLANTGTTVTNTATNLANDAIKDVHIDWGTGAQQVSAADVPIADSGAYYAVDTVESALGELGPLLSANEILQHVTTGTTYLAAGYPVIYCTSPITINLPAAATVNNRVYHVVNVGTGVVIVDPNSSELINGTTMLSVAGSAAAMIHSNGTAWWTLSNG